MTVSQWPQAVIGIGHVAGTSGPSGPINFGWRANLAPERRHVATPYRKRPVVTLPGCNSTASARLAC